MWYQAAVLVCSGCALIGLLATACGIVALFLGRDGVLSLDRKMVAAVAITNCVAIVMIMHGLLELI